MDEGYFRDAYAKDAANQARQSWDEYRRWVRTFYDGKRLPPVPGWSAREEEILAKTPTARRDAVRTTLAETGKALAAEWAKDNAVRRVSTSDLQTWGKRFGALAGEADALVAALADVQREIARRHPT